MTLMSVPCRHRAKYFYFISGYIHKSRDNAADSVQIAVIQGDSLARGRKILSNAEHRQMQVTGRVQYIARGPCCFPSFSVCVYKFSSHYLNNIVFYRQ